MSLRCRADLNGCSSRLQSSLSKWRETLAEIEESWNDETAQSFYSQSLGNVESAFARMIGSLQDASEVVRGFEKRIFDPGSFE